VREVVLVLSSGAGGVTPPLRAGDRADEIEAGVGGKSV
jgi:hypothetical protein